MRFYTGSVNSGIRHFATRFPLCLRTRTLPLTRRARDGANTNNCPSDGPRERADRFREFQPSAKRKTHLTEVILGEIVQDISVGNAGSAHPAEKVCYGTG